MGTSTTHVTVVAVFSNVSNAKAAARDLAANGFVTGDISLYSPEAAAASQGGYDEQHFTQHEEGIRGWLKSLFRSEEHTEAQRDYENAFRSGNTIVALNTAEQNAERAADILNRYSPNNIHEEAGDASLATAAGTSVATRGGIGTPPSRRN